MRFPGGIVALVIASAGLAGQQAPDAAQEMEHARRLMGSPQLADKAWGVYLAGRLHSDEFDRLLIEEFRSAAVLRDASSYTEDVAFLAVLFDAAIEAGITVPAGLLEPFTEKWIDPVLILAARDKDSDELLFALRGDKSRDIVWLAANNLLFERRSQRWYTAILNEVGVTHRFIVTDSGAGAGSSAGAGGGVCGDGVAQMPPGFPPVTLFHLENNGRRGSVLLARGPEDVFYKRTIVPTDKQVGFGECSSLVDAAAMRVGYLAKLRHWSVEQTGELFHRETTVPYSTLENFSLEVDRHLKAQEQGIREFIQAVSKDGLTIPDVRLHLAPEISDRRQRATDPLPVPAPRDIALLTPSAAQP
ncbi:MAG TPA: hypothetical protein VKU01_31960 [Bryobacteraceae bacterium]|nr:hypothetical protein [Bryobacteraceae bacterium]